MKNLGLSSESGRAARGRSATPVLLGIAGSLALWAGWTVLQAKPRTRRFADRGADRRSPMSLFTPGLYLRRRSIDRSGAYPLFERRESVYDAY